jgi:phospholipid/cholesterol/gamma-HCH transport system ATP-binding protein
MSPAAESMPGEGAEHAFVALRGVRKAFGALQVLDGIDLDVQHGRVLTILGGSGSGKSVMLKHMIGLLRPDSGSVWVEGRDVTHLGERELFPVRRRIGYVFQGAALFDSLSVYENVAYPLREHLDWSEPEIAQRVAESLESVGLPGVEEKMPAELSGGMRKRVGVARAISLRPTAILYDEPTTGLDPANSRRIGQLISRLQRELNMTSVVVTHEIELCLAVSDRIVLLSDGRLAIDTDVESFKTSDAPEVKSFLGIADGQLER